MKLHLQHRQPGPAVMTVTMALYICNLGESCRSILCSLCWGPKGSKRAGLVPYKLLRCCWRRPYTTGIQYSLVLEFSLFYEIWQCWCLKRQHLRFSAFKLNILSNALTRNRKRKHWSHWVKNSLLNTGAFKSTELKLSKRKWRIIVLYYIIIIKLIFNISNERTQYF